MMGVNGIFRGNHFMIYVNQMIMLYTLNLYNAICQLYLNKAKKKIHERRQREGRPGVGL